MEIAEVKYQGELKTEAEHKLSGQVFTTDAPPDNNGNGDAFSPTDLLATSLATCMVTTMSISAQKHNLLLDDVTVTVSKAMASNPRRVDEIKLEFDISAPNLTDGQKQLLEEAAYNCPVAMSLSENVKQEIVFEYS